AVALAEAIGIRNALAEETQLSFRQNVISSGSACLL
ncbi:hypothetical protein TSMEX_009393, partial [Taenia solium]